MFESIQDFLKPFSSELAAHIVRRWNDFTQVVNEKEIQKELIPELMQMFAVSDFAADTCCHYSNILFDLIETGDLERSYTRQDYKNKLSSMHTYTQDEDLMVFLRKYRRREMLRIAWRDLTQVAELSETLADLTQMADCLLTEVLEILYNRQAEILGYPASISGKRQKLYIIAAGKLGGLELNFSSDVDLIFVYPEDWLTEDVEEPISNQEFFTRLAQRFIKVLNTPTADGFVYRVDMRLRPYGEGGPLVMSLPALQSYFHEQARDWERYALVKARVLAPPDQSVRTLENMMNQFVYRRYVDFGVIEALRQMKQKIQQEVRSKRLQDDIKRGPGGIRQVEFVVQAFQLMRGGLKPFLQQRHLLTALNYLKDKHALGDAVVELGQAYQFLRRSEHCLQMVSDSQTHALPNEPWSQLRLAYAMGFNNWEDFLTQLNIYREYVQNYFERFLAKKQYSQIENLNDEWFQQLLNSWKLKFADSAMAYQLTQLGFPSGEETRVILSEFADSYRCTNLSALGRERLNQLMPILLQLVVKTKNPMETLNRIILLLEAIARRSAYLSLLLENPTATEYVVKLFSSSRWIATHVTEHPFLLDELINSEVLTEPLKEQELEDELRQRLLSIPEEDLEQQMETLRRFKHIQVLRVAAADLTGSLRLMKVSDHLTWTAEVVIRQVQKIAWKDLMTKHAASEGKENLEYFDSFGIMAYGKLGGIELSYISDLDLVFLHIGSFIQPEFPIRLAQRIIRMLSTRTASGVLYRVDTRLRPSGAAGLLVSSLDAFVEYQKNMAWTWEHQALVRARVISGSQEIKQQFLATRHEVLSRQCDPEQLKREIIEMRRKMREANTQAKPGYFDVKHDVGGMTDIEFIVQYGVLAWSHEYPDLLQYTDNIRILESFSGANLLSARTAKVLAMAYLVYRKVVHRAVLQDEIPLVPMHKMSYFRRHVSTVWEKLLGSEVKI